MSLTLETIRNAAAVLADYEKVGLYSLDLFFADRAVTFKASDGEVFHVAHSAFWAKLERELIFTDAPQATKSWFVGRTLWGMPVIDLDVQHSERDRVMKAMADAVPVWKHTPDPTPRRPHWMPYPSVT